MQFRVNVNYFSAASLKQGPGESLSCWTEGDSDSNSISVVSVTVHKQYPTYFCNHSSTRSD